MRYKGLAAAVVERLAPHVPEGIEVAEEPPGFLRVSLGGERWEVLPLDEPELEEEIELDTYDPPYPAFAVLEALDFLQEVVRSEVDPEWGGEAWAELAGDEIRAGFRDGPRLAPIALSSLSTA